MQYTFSDWKVVQLTYSDIFILFDNKNKLYRHGMFILPYLHGQCFGFVALPFVQTSMNI